MTARQKREGDGLQILVAEDDQMQREAVSSHLSSWGYEPITCVDGGQAREVQQKEDAPRLLLLDLGMPVAAGLIARPAILPTGCDLFRCFVGR